MSREPNVLQDSLDAADRFRTRVIAGIVVLFVTIVFAHAWLMATAASRTGGAPGMAKMIVASETALMFFVALCTVVIALQITRMTKAVLRAIELSSRK
jgi:hypothetical protein